MTRQVLAERQILRKLRRDTRALLNQIAATVPVLTVVAGSPLPDDVPASLRVSPFGPGRLYFDGRVIDASALPPRAREVLFFVAHQLGSTERNVLIETIWEGGTRASQSLWDASRHIRRLLGERHWTIRGGRYSLNVVVNDDAVQFEAEAAITLGSGSDMEKLAAGERAIALIQPGIFMEWCDSLWAASLRAHYTRLALAVLLEMAERYDFLGRVDEVNRILRKAVDVDPLDERPRRAIVRTLAQQGMVREAIREYRAYRDMVRREFDAEPSAELRRMVANLGKRLGQGAGPRSGPPQGT